MIICSTERLRKAAVPRALCLKGNEIMKIRKKNGGYMTIEITMIFTVMFFALLLILFIGIVLYQEVRLQSLAVLASERGSVVYSSRVSDMNSGVKTLEDFEDRDPYRNIPFLDSARLADYETLVNNYVVRNLDTGSILSGNSKNRGDFVTIKDYLIVKRVQVNIQYDYTMPIASIPEMFGWKGPFEVNTTAVSTVVDPPEMVRSVDIASDVLQQTSFFGTVENGYEKIMNAIEKAQKFFE